MFNRKGVRTQKTDQKGDSYADEPQGEGYYSVVGGGQQNAQELGRRRVIGTTQSQGLKYGQTAVGK